jgi:hypothetical protein
LTEADPQTQIQMVLLNLAYDLEEEAQRHDDAEPLTEEGLFRMIEASQRCRQLARHMREFAEYYG